MKKTQSIFQIIYRNYDWVWIGLHLDKSKHGNTWYWISGSKSTYMNWLKGQPDNPMDVNAGMIQVSVAQWHDPMKMSEEQYFVCDRSVEG